VIFSRRASFWLVAFAFTATMIGTTLPTPLYPSYEKRFGFGPVTVTVVFAMYAVGVLTALLLVGRASDTVGRRPVLLAGLALAGLSSVIFVIAGGVHADGTAVLLAGRLLSGFSAGIFTGTATATLADLAGPRGGLRASLVAAVSNIGGLGLGPLVGGLLARYAGAPLRTSYALHAALIALAIVAVLLVPEPVDVQRPRRLRIQRIAVPAQVRGALAQAGTAGFAGFAVLGLFTAVSPSLLGLLGHHSSVLTGVVVFSVFAASAVGQVTSARVPADRALRDGTAILVVGIAGVGGSIAAASLALLVAGGVVAGFGQGLSFRAALGSLSAVTPEHQRGGVASTFFAICYVGISVPVVGVGLGTRAFGLTHTGEVFAGIIGLLSLAALASLTNQQHRNSPT
jgi:MFS family permease